jgi:hypothetical protein
MKVGTSFRGLNTELTASQVLHGSLKETLYDLPKGEDMHGKPKAPLCPKKETIYHENEVTYMSDNVTFTSFYTLLDKLTYLV